jgi:arylsulfatase A-like enzyme
MTRARILLVVAVLSAAHLFAGPPPNFIVLLADDLGWPMMNEPMDPALPSSGSRYYETPAMNRLAREGMRFTSAYASAPLCTPTRRSLLCGMTPARQRGTMFPSEFQPAQHLTIPKALKNADASYLCAHFGKWGEQMNATPAQCGYDSSDGSTGNKTGGFAGVPKRGPRNRPTALVDDPKLTFSVTRRGIDFLTQRAADRRPFYLQLSYYAIHEDNQTLAATQSRYERKGPPPVQIQRDLAAMLEDLNTGMTQLLDAVDRLGLATNTFILFTSDNGANTKLYEGDDTSAPPANHPLRGGKQTLHEGGIRVPFLVRGPGVKPGSVSRVPVALYDLLPTLFDLAGGKAALSAELDGGSFRAVLQNKGEGAVQRPLPGLVFHFPPHSALRVGDWKLLKHADGAKELYDLADDIGEATDLAAKHPDKLAELDRILTAYLKAVNAETAARNRP